MITYTIFATIVAILLAFDLYSHKDGGEIPLSSAVKWSLFYVAAGVGFSVYIGYAISPDAAKLYLTGYALEKVLAVDNLFAFMLVFSYFGIEAKYQHRILYWGIIGAIVFRAIFVALGTGFTTLFGPWAEIVFALIIGWTAYQMLKGGGDDEEDVDYNNVWYIRWFKKWLPVTEKTQGGDFFVKVPKDNKVVWAATPVFLCLIAIEFSDVIFAFDSVPAIIAVTKEPFLVFSAMLFAILGLRSLYFVLDALKRILSRLETMVIVILAFIAFKLGISSLSKLAIQFNIVDLQNPIHIDPTISLVIIISLLGIGVGWSLMEKNTD